jgi:lactam utilization protein B
MSELAAQQQQEQAVQQQQQQQQQVRMTTVKGASSALTYKGFCMHGMWSACKTQQYPI